MAALGARMLRLAAELADGTATWMTGPKTLAEHTIPTFRAAAGGTQKRVVLALPVAVTDDVAAAKARAAENFKIYGVLPSYPRCSTVRAQPARRTWPSSATPRR